MTKTYNDIDAVTRLLEEKERDLELAARIGQSLLEQNKELKQRNESLEHEITSANDTVDRLGTELIACTERVTQLRHELSLKNGLLQIYSKDLDTDSEAGSPTREHSFIANWDLLQKKIHSLEDENVQLRTESTLRTEDIEEEERKEMQLINDCIKQLGEANNHKTQLQDEIAKKVEDNVRQQEEITHLLSQVVELQRRNRQLGLEHEELMGKLAVARECQGELSAELLEVKEQYGELLACFQELQEETRRSSRQRLGSNMTPTHSPTATSQWPLCGIYSPSYANPDCLASELMESSMGSDGYASDDRVSSNQNYRIFQTVKYANSGRSGRLPRRHSHQPLSLLPQQQHTQSHPGSSPSIGRSAKFSSWSHLSHLTAGVSTASDSESAYTDSYHTDDESLYSSLSSTGRAVTVGSDPKEADSCATELAAALRQMGQPLHERESGCRTPDSVLSCDGSLSGGRHFAYYLQQGIRSKNYYLPDKLKIIKPLEGSQTLHHWQRLATPHLGVLFETRPGVQVRGGESVATVGEDEAAAEPDSSNVQKEDDLSFSDLEEDDDIDYLHPGKSFMNTCSVYTYTNSTILHPNDQTNVTSSYSRLQLSTGASVGISPPTHLELQGRRDSLNLQRSATSTFSTTLGLAKLLNERGIHAMVPSTMKGKMASPTPTPCPSPETTPPPSPPPYDSVRIPDLLQEGSTGNLLAKNAHLLRTNSQRRRKRKKGVPEKVTRGQQTSLSIGLLEKLSRFGVNKSQAATRTSSVAPSLPSTVGLASLVVQSPTADTTVPFPGGRDSPLTYHRATGVASHKKIPQSAAMTFGSPRKSTLSTDTQVTISGSRPIATVLPCSHAPSVSHTVPAQKPETLLPPTSDASQKSKTVAQSWTPPTPMLKSPGSLKLAPAMVPPLSRMPNPMLQLNCHLLQPQPNLNHNNNNNELVGTVGALRTLRKGGYV